MSEIITFRMKGKSALIMHNGRLADQACEFSVRMKEINSKKSKRTKADFDALQRIEFEGGLYHDEVLGPYIPGANIEACIADGARTERRGQDCLIGVQCLAKAKVLYKGPRDVDEMWAKGTFTDLRCVRIRQDRIVRCRPVFESWQVDDLSIMYQSDVVNREDVIRWFQIAGSKKGICDGTPKYGRFACEEIS